MKTQKNHKKSTRFRVTWPWSPLSGQPVGGTKKSSLLHRLGLAGVFALLCPVSDAAPLPDDVQLTVTVNGQTQTLNLHKRSARGVNFSLRTWDSTNGYVVVSNPEVRTFRGTVSENPNAMIFAAIDANNMLSAFSFDMDESHNTQWYQSVDVTSQLASPATPAAMPAQATGAPVPGSTGTPKIGTKVPTGQAANGVKYGEMVDFEMGADLIVASYNGAGQNVDSTLAQYELNALIYENMLARSNLIRLRESATVIRKENFYASDPGAVHPNTIATEWNRVGGPLTSLPWDCAWGSVGTVSNGSWGHGAGFAAGVLYHENAHNWGAEHLTYASDSMGGSNPSLGPITADVIWAKRKYYIDAGDLPQSTPFPDPIHPYTHVDAARVTRNTAQDIDVLANDFDSNGDTLTISSFTTTTRNGGTVTLNPNGTLHYVPATNFVGKDMVVYTAQDSSTMGLKTRDILHIEVVNNDLMAAYSFEETSGVTAADSTGLAPPADLNFADFATDSVLSPLGHGIRASGWQTTTVQGGDWSGIILGAGQAIPAAQTLYPNAGNGRKYPFELEAYNRYGNGYDPLDGNYSFSTWFRADNYVGYTYIASKWYYSEEAFGWELRVPNGTLQLNWRIFDGTQPLQTLSVAYPFVPGKWYHVTSVFDRASGEARLFLNGERVATKAGAFPSNGNIFAGRSPITLGSGTQGKCCYDETRIYSKALTDSEVKTLYTSPGTVPRFLDSSMALNVVTGVPFTRSLWPSIWTGGGNALTFSIASGPSWLNVSPSGELSGTHSGSMATSSAVVRMTDGDGNYADLTVNITPQEILATGLAGRWKMDETSGTTADDATGNPHDGTVGGSTPTWGTGVMGGALTLNDTNQSVVIPPLNLTSDTVTISGWFKRNGTQNPTGLVFTRGSTTNGLTLNANELRYAWNNGYYNLSTGLTLPDNTWTFCAMVIEPSKATVYMQPAGGAMQSWVNVMGHSAATIDGNLNLGNDPITYGRLFKGSIDDVRIYARALTAAEVGYVSTNNVTPAFVANPVMKTASFGVACSGGLAGDVSDGDPGDTLTFVKLSGPSWLSVASDGTLSGTPAIVDAGNNVFTVSVTDAVGATSTGNLQIWVTSPLVNGTWSNTAGGNWSNAANWSGGNIANGAGNTANVSSLNLTSNATVTLDGPRTIGNLSFGDTTPSHSWTLAGSPLTLDVSTGQPTITVTNGTALVSAVMGGSDGLAKAGSGTLVLTGANTWTSTTTINAGTLQLGDGGTTGSLGSGIIVDNGTLAYNYSSTSSVSLPTNLSISGSGNLSATARDIKFNGNITLGGSQNYTQTGGGGLYQGIEVVTSSTLRASSITLVGDVGKYGSTGNILALDTSASNGAVNLNASFGRPYVFYPLSDVTINAGTGAINVTGSGPASSGWSSTPVTLIGAMNVTAAVNASGPVTINATANGTVSGVLSGGMALTKQGSGTLSLTGANTNSGPIDIKEGVLTFIAPGNVNWTVPSGTKTITSGATMKVDFSPQTTQLRQTNVGPTVINAGGILELYGTVDNVNSHYEINSWAASGPGTIRVTGGGSIANWTAASNSLSGFTGLLDIQSGRFACNVNSTATLGGTFDVNVAATGKLDLRSGHFTIDALDGAAGSLVHKSYLDTINFTIGSGNGSGSFAGVLSGSNYTVIKTGTGTQTFSGANTYSGATTVSAGTLNVTGSLTSTSAVTVQTGGTLGGTGTISRPVTVQSGGTIAPGTTSTGTLAVGHTLTLAGTAAMQIGRTGTTLSADKVMSVTTLTYGGTLLVTNIGTDALLAGHRFQLFSASTYSGSFSTLTLPTLGAGLSWNTSRLTVDGTISVQGTVPSGWTAGDIGSVGIPGGSNVASGVYTVSGSGAAIGGTADAFHSISQALVGDGEIRARITSQTNTHAQALAGVMLRDGTTAGAANVFLALTPASGFVFQARATSGGSTTSLATAASNTAPNNWMRLTRSGTLFTAYVSADGSTWTLVGSTTVSMGSSLSAGLPVTSHDNAVLGTATFDNVAVTTYPSPWVTVDIGTTGVAGRSEYFNNVHTLNGAGVVGGTADGFHYTYQTLTADGDITVRIPVFANTGTSSRVGVMIRDTLAAGSANVFLGTDASGAFTWAYRSITGGTTTTANSGTAIAPNVWVKLSRSGSIITASSSTDGTSWTAVGTVTVTMATNCCIGVAVGSGNTTGLNESSFDGVTVTP